MIGDNNREFFYLGGSVDIYNFYILRIVILLKRSKVFYL